MTKILIAGTDYGLQNIGDDAILVAMLEQLDTIDNLDITVATKHADEMAGWLKVKTLERAGKSNLLKIYKEIFSADVLIVGGACVISGYQKGLKGLISGYPGFGLTLIAVAKILKKPVMVYGIGVEDIPSKLKRFFIKKIYNSVEVITLRDEGSLDLLKNTFGVTKPKMCVTADPVLGMNYPDAVRSKNVELVANLNFKDASKPLVGVSFAYGVDTRDELVNFVSEMSNYIIEELGANILFIPMNIIATNDLAGINNVVETIRHKDSIRILQLPYSYTEVMNLVSEMDMVISSRMHLLIFSSVTKTPVIGISRVPKTDQFLQNFGLKSVVSTNALNFNEVKESVNEAWKKRDVIKKSLEDAREHMHNRAWDNVRCLKEYVLSNNKI